MGRLSVRVWYFALPFLSLLCVCNAATPTLYFTAANSSLFINSNLTLNSNLIAGNLTIANGVTVYTNGYEIFVAGNLIAENDSFITGRALTNSGGGANSILTSYGCSGGAGGGYSGIGSGAGGGSTIATGGTWSGPGSCPADPVMDNSNIAAWYNGGFQNYLEGASGGHGQVINQCGTCSNGGSSSFGIYIQAGSLILANSVIYANSPSDAGTGDRIGGGGGGGAGGTGRIMLAYQNEYIPGTYNTVSGHPGGGRNGGGPGGLGGEDSNTLTYGFFSPPILVLGPGSLPLNLTGACYSLGGVMMHQHTSVYLAGSWFDISPISIGALGSSVTVNRVNYTLLLNQTQRLPAEGDVCLHHRTGQDKCGQLRRLCYMQRIHWRFYHINIHHDK